MADPHAIAECLNEACHGGEFESAGHDSDYETGPTITQNGQTYFELNMYQSGQFKIIVEKLTS